jgi:hypothetical protein
MNNDGISPNEGQEMCYDMLSIDDKTENEKLEKYSGAVDWSYLRTHYQQDALLYVDASLQLAQVGEVIVSDDKAQVEHWLQTGDLLKPGPAHAEYWESSKIRFTAMVVSPFILIQPLSTGSP